jgi:hypothetical protein
MTEPLSPHPVYPGWPPCQPNCPGPWSSYHDGYADGYDAAFQPVPETLDETLRRAVYSVWPGLSQDDMRRLIAALLAALAPSREESK